MAFSQPATFNEPWSDERVLNFLHQLPPQGVDADFHVLYNAYKHMRPHDFNRLVNAFVAQGRNLQARDAQGHTIYDIINQYPQHRDEFLAILNAI